MQLRVYHLLMKAGFRYEHVQWDWPIGKGKLCAKSAGVRDLGEYDLERISRITTPHLRSECCGAFNSKKTLPESPI